MSSDIATNIPRDDPQLGVRAATGAGARGSGARSGDGRLRDRLGGRAALPDHRSSIATGTGFYDYLLQGPLLVILVGLVFALAIAPGLVEDLAGEVSRDPEG